MHIGFLTHTFPGVTETFVFNQVAGLLDLGHEVSVIATDHAMPPGTSHPVIDRYGLRERSFYLGTLPTSAPARARYFAKEMASSGRPPLGQLLRSLNVIRYGKAAWSFRLASHALRLKDLPHRFDAIVCHYGPWGLHGLRLREIGALHGPLAVVFHGYDVTSLPRQRGPKLYDPLFRSDVTLLPISDYFRHRLIALGARDEQIRVHHMGVNVADYAYVPRDFPQHNEPWRFVSVGRLEEKKGFETAIRALAQVRNSLPPFHYDIIGDGRLRPRLESLVEQLELGDVITLHGWQRQDQVAQWLRDAHLMIAPSLTAESGDMEGIPVVLMEALATGLPTLSTNHSGIPELVRDGDTGFLAAENDIDNLAETLQRLLSRRDELQAVGKRGRAHVEAEFNLDHLNAQLANVLSGLAGHRH